jgi:hypothetical protein
LRIETKINKEANKDVLQQNSIITYRPPKHKDLMFGNKDTNAGRSSLRRTLHTTVERIDQITDFSAFSLACVICPEDSLDAYRMHVRNAPVAWSGCADCAELHSVGEILARLG